MCGGVWGGGVEVGCDGWWVGVMGGAAGEYST